MNNTEGNIASNLNEKTVTLSHSSPLLAPLKEILLFDFNSSGQYWLGLTPSGCSNPAEWSSSDVRFINVTYVNILPSDQTLSKGECPLTACSIEAQNFAADPINTYSGNNNYRVTDLSIPAVGQPLHFERSYNSLPVTGTAVYSRPLGYGWTHNCDINLTLTGDPGGEADTAILKAPHGSRLRFEDQGDGSYEPYPGVWATMTRQGTSAPYTYVITAANQTVYTFGVLSDSVAVESSWGTPPAGLTLGPDYSVAAAPGAVFSLTHTLVVGAHGYGKDAQTTDSGRAFVYYGNGGDGLDLLPRQMRVDGSAPIVPLGLSDSATGVQLRLIGRMPLGREDVKLHWQVAPLGTPFTATTVISGTSAEWIDTGTSGAVITQNVSGLTPETAYHWRVRLRYRPGNRLGQSASRWVHIPWNGWAEQDFRTPGGTELVADFSAQPLTGTVPLTVTFTNLSTPTAAITSALWAYGDGVISNTLALTHTHTYTGAGVYTVTLAVSDSVVTDTLTRTNYITVSTGYTTATRVITYTYDHLYRLTDADYSTGERFEYGYDAVGNRTVHTWTITSTAVTTYTYDAANRLDYFYEDGDQTDLTWDDNGNLLAQGTSVYTWDAANRLVSANVDGVASTFEYDGLGNRVAQTVDGVTTEYVLDVAGGLPEVIVATSSGASTYYVQVSGQILAQQNSGAWTHILPDHLGSVRHLVGSDSQVDLAQSFDPFGDPFEASGSGASDFGYTGEQINAGTALLFLRARYYYPVTGRFLSKDPWGGDDLQPQSLNGWSYVEGNPVNRLDPSGHCWGPLEFLRDVPYYDKTCENLDMAILIAGHPYASPCDKAKAIAYVEWAAISHLILAEALFIAGYSVVLEAGVIGGEICQDQGCFEPPPEGEPALPEPSSPRYGPLPPDKLPPDWEPSPLHPEGPVEPEPGDIFLPDERERSPLYGSGTGGRDRRSEECREIWFEYTLARWQKWEAEESLRDMEERNVPEWIKAPIRAALKAYEARIAELEEKYRFYGCGSMGWTDVPDRIP